MPSRSTLIRWGGLAAVAAGALYVLGPVSWTLDYPLSYYFDSLHLNAVWGMPMQLLLLGGLMGLHARQVGRHGYGRLGTAGFVLAFAGSLLAVVLGPLMLPGGPGGWPPSLVGMVVTGAVGVAVELGILLLGVATLRAAVLPSPWRALPLVIFLLNTPFSFLGPQFMAAGINPSIFMVAQQLLLGLGWVLIGYALWSGMGEGAWRSTAPAR